MSSLAAAGVQALQLIAGTEPKLLEIILLSPKVSLTTVAFACVIGLPVGAAIAVGRFPGRHTLIVVLNALVGLPPVLGALNATAYVVKEAAQRRYG